VKIDAERAALFRCLHGVVSSRLLLKEVFEMTEEEAQKAERMLFEENLNRERLAVEWHLNRMLERADKEIEQKQKPEEEEVTDEHQ
jgi:hypothetical protein